MIYGWQLPKLVSKFVFLLLLVVSCGSNDGSNLFYLHCSEKLEVTDICSVDDKVFVTGLGEHAVYRIDGNVLVPFVGKPGVGELKFRYPNCIKSVGSKLYVGDGENLQIQVIDTSGAFVTAYPRRSQSEFSFLDEKHAGEWLGKFFVNKGTMGLVSGYGEGGKAVSSIYIKQTAGGDFEQLGGDWSGVAALELDTSSDAIVVAVYADGIHRFDLETQQWQSVGRYANKQFQFNVIHDMNILDGRIYVLDQILGMGDGNDGLSRIFVFDSSLTCIDTLNLPTKMFAPIAFDFVENGSMIIVSDISGTSWSALDVPVYKD